MYKCIAAAADDDDLWVLVEIHWLHKLLYERQREKKNTVLRNDCESEKLKIMRQCEWNTECHLGRTQNTPCTSLTETYRQNSKLLKHSHSHRLHTTGKVWIMRSKLRSHRQPKQLKRRRMLVLCKFIKCQRWKDGKILFSLSHNAADMLMEFLKCRYAKLHAIPDKRSWLDSRIESKMTGKTCDTPKVQSMLMKMKCEKRGEIVWKVWKRKINRD